MHIKSFGNVDFAIKIHGERTLNAFKPNGIFLGILPDNLDEACSKSQCPPKHTYVLQIICNANIALQIHVDLNLSGFALQQDFPIYFTRKLR